MKGVHPAVALACALLFGAAAERSAAAQGAAQLQAQADVDTVSVGDVLHLELTAQSGDGMPTDPQPGATPGFVVRGQSSSPSQTHIIMNGSRIDRFGLTVDWSLQAQRVGTFSLGPPTALVGGVRFSARAVTVRVVPAGQAPPRPPPSRQPQGRAPFNFSPFDPWRSIFPNIDRGLDEPPPQQPAITTDPKLALDAPRGELFFLHATVDPPVAVVGQQVTFSVYEYIDQDTSATEVDPSDEHEPTAPDFVKRQLLKEDKEEALLVGYASVGGHTWRVDLVRRWALFPLRAGDLTVGPMSVTIARPRALAGSKRTTEALHVRTTEPPVAGRPPGYALGDVGKLTLTAQVVPRDIEQGGAVGVHLELGGTGNVPAALAPPARAGVEWLTPEVHEQLGSVGRESFGGKRTFDYVVRVRTPGNVDLGEVTLPFWDPEQRRYEVARAPLGTVHVTPSSSPAPSAAAADQPLAGLPAPRDTLEGADVARPHLDDKRLFWVLGVGLWPLAFGVAVAGRAGGRRVARAWRERRASPLTKLRERVTAAGVASHGTDARAVDAATARAVEAASVAHAGVNVRGAIGAEVAERLTKAGVAAAVASTVADLLRECEAARFSPDAADIASARDRWARARRAIRDLERR